MLPPMAVGTAMAATVSLFATCLVVSAAMTSPVFNHLFQPSWGSDHFIYQGDLLKLKLDSTSGAGFESKSKYMYGKATVQMKLVAGDSAGIVTAFYMASEGPYHNEFDMEFLGNATGEPYVVQTNVFVEGVGNREQRFNLWFDPSQDFHNYSILWTQRHIVFMVDETPIRVHANLETQGIPYPMGQTVGVHTSIWNADEWATQGGILKTDWSHSPFFAEYKSLHIDACDCPIPSAATDNIRRCTSGPHRRYSWDGGDALTLHQAHQLRWVRANYLLYDYCDDTRRFLSAPDECVHHRHLFRGSPT